MAISFVGFCGINSSSSSIIYHSPFGGNSSSVLSNAEFVAPAAGVLSNLSVRIFSNSSTSNDTITLYVNGVASALQATITAATTGTFSDVTHSVNISAGDLIAIGLSQSATSIWLGNVSMELNA